MTNARLIAISLLACAACESSAKSKPQLADHAAPAAAPEAAAAPGGSVAPAPAPAPATRPAPDLAQILDGATAVTGKDIDATALGPVVDAYMVTRAGGRSDREEDAQHAELALVLVGGGRALRLELQRFATMMSPPEPFGTMTLAEPLPPGGKVSEDNTFFHAPAYRGPTPLVIGHLDAFGDETAYVVGRDDAGLVVSSAYLAYEEDTSKKWDREARIKLAPGADVRVPRATITLPPLAAGAPIRLIEHATDARFRTFTLQIGDRRGPIGDCQQAPGEPTGTRDVPLLPAPLTPAAFAAREPKLAGPAVPVAEVVAYDVCRNADWSTTFVVGRDGDALKVLARQDLPEPGEWRTVVDVPLAAPVKTAVR